MRFCLTLLLTPLLICVARAAESTTTTAAAASESPVRATNDVLWKRQTPPNPLVALLPASLPSDSPGENPDTDAFVEASNIDLSGTGTTGNSQTTTRRRRDLSSGGWSDFIAHSRKPDQTLQDLNHEPTIHKFDEPLTRNRVHTAPVNAVAEAADAERQGGVQRVDETGDGVFDLKDSDGGSGESSAGSFVDAMPAIGSFPIHSGSSHLGDDATAMAMGAKGQDDGPSHGQMDEAFKAAKEWHDGASEVGAHGGEGGGMPATWSRLFGARGAAPPAF